MRILFSLCTIFTLGICSDMQAQWVQADGPYEGSINCLIGSGTNLFAGTQGAGVYLSTNSGTQWTAVNTGLPELNDIVYSIAIKGTDIFAGTPSGVFLSTNNGTSWTAATSGITGGAVNCFAVVGTDLFAGTQGGIFRSTNNGTAWTGVNVGLPAGSYIFSLAVKGTTLFAGTNSNGVYVSTNNGANWSWANTGLTDSTARSLTTIGSLIFVGTYSGVFRSTNDGAKWTLTSLKNQVITTSVANGTDLFAGTFNNGVFFSSDSGASWVPVNTGLPPYAQATMLSLTVLGTNIFAGTSGKGVYLSTNNGTDWTPVNTGIKNTNVDVVAGNGSLLYAGTVFGSGVFRSSDQGATWTAPDTGMTQPISQVSAFAFMGTQTFAGTSNGAFASSNNGANWTDINAGLPPMYHRVVNSMAVINTNLFAVIEAGTTSNAVYLTTDTGASWSPTNYSSTTNSANVLTTTPDGSGGTYLYLGTLGAGVYRSTDNGTTWVPANTNITTARVNAFASIQHGGNTSLFAGTTNGIYVSTDYGGTWTRTDSGFFTTDINALAVSGNNLFAGTVLGVYGSTNGKGWSNISTGFPSDPLLPLYPLINSLTIVGNDLAAGTFFLGVWKRPLSQITAVDVSSHEIPDKMKLEQNYPNPFNPVTKIKFEIQSTAFVTLKVLDVLGREVTTLINRELTPGSYETKLDGSKLASGVYFYRLTAGKITQTRKLVLQK